MGGGANSDERRKGEVKRGCRTTPMEVMAQGRTNMKNPGTDKVCSRKAGKLNAGGYAILNCGELS